MQLFKSGSGHGYVRKRDLTGCGPAYYLLCKRYIQFAFLKNFLHNQMSFVYIPVCTKMGLSTSWMKKCFLCFMSRSLTQKVWNSNKITQDPQTMYLSKITSALLLSEFLKMKQFDLPLEKLTTFKIQFWVFFFGRVLFVCLSSYI